jgi:DNA-binding MarR family transcriptional regulator
MIEKFRIDRSPGFLLSRANASMRSRFNSALNEKGIEATAEQYGLLSIINENPGTIQSDIGVKSGKDKTNVTRMLKLLETRGFIKRKKDPEDSRVFRIFITNSGRNLLEKMRPLAVATNREALAGINPEEITRFMTILDKIHSNTAEGEKS